VCLKFFEISQFSFYQKLKKKIALITEGAIKINTIQKSALKK